MKEALVNALFWLHLPFVAVWLGLFFIPLSVWPARAAFHFWYMLSLTIVQLGWGMALYPKTKKVMIICPLTTWMQSLRGIPAGDKRNYSYTYVAEVSRKLKIAISNKAVNVLSLGTLGIGVVNYILFA